MIYKKLMQHKCQNLLHEFEAPISFYSSEVPWLCCNSANKYAIVSPRTSPLGHHQLKLLGAKALQTKATFIVVQADKSFFFYF